MDDFPRECTHICPSCGGHFFGSSFCRGSYPDFHPEPVETLPLVGCQRPPLRHYVIVIDGFSVRATTPHEARESARETIKMLLGGDTKLAEKMTARLDPCIGVSLELDEGELDGLPATIAATRDDTRHRGIVIGVRSRRHLRRMEAEAARLTGER
jgi:hypothetical protein